MEVVAIIIGAQSKHRSGFSLQGGEVDKTWLEGSNLGQNRILVQVVKILVYKHLENRCSVIKMERRFQGVCGVTSGSQGTRHVPT